MEVGQHLLTKRGAVSTEICYFLLSHYCNSFPVTTFVSKWHFVYFSGLLLLQWINKDVLGLKAVTADNAVVLAPCWRRMIIPLLCSCMATLRLCTWLQELELILDWCVRMEALNLDWLRKNQRTIRSELYGRSCNHFIDAYT